MTGFNHPSSRSVSRNLYLVNFLFATASNMRYISMFDYDFLKRHACVGGISAQMFGIIKRQFDDICRQCLSQTLGIIHVCDADRERQWYPLSVHQQVPFGTFFSPIRGIRTCCLATERGFRHRSIDALPIQVYAGFPRVFDNSRLPCLVEKSATRPLLKVTVNGRTAAKFTRNCIPLTTST